jgi:hypothetical protein
MHDTSPRTASLSIRLAAGLIGAMLACAAAAQGAWTRIAPAGEAMSPRSTPAAAAIGTQVFLFGGVRDDLRAGENVFFNDLHRFDTRTHQWARLTPAGAVPPPRAFAAAVPLERRRQVLVFGGATFTPDLGSVVAFDDLWSYDVRRNEWTQLRSATAGPPGRANPLMWQVGERVFVFSGATGSQQALNDLWMFDLRTSRWAELVPNGAAGAPPARFAAYAGTEASLGRLTVYGGLSGADAGFAPLNDTWQFDLRSRTWTEVTPPPEANIVPGRNIGSAVNLGFSMLVHGGDLPGGSSGCGAGFPQNPTDELWRFDLLRLRWAQLAPGGDPAPKLKRTAAASVNGRMFVFGGFDFVCAAEDDPGQIWNDAVFSFAPGR